MKQNPAKALSERYHCKSENWEALADAVVLQAVRDWLAIRQRIRKRGETRERRKQLEEVEGFFLSKYFGILAPGMDGELLLLRLREAERRGDRVLPNDRDDGRKRYGRLETEGSEPNGKREKNGGRGGTWTAD